MVEPQFCTIPYLEWSDWEWYTVMSVHINIQSGVIENGTPSFL